ncbi:UNVERIFIED_CONTAM: hypothetical protein K2H54_051207 [Gekko kuhli]
MCLWILTAFTAANEMFCGSPESPEDKLKSKWQKVLGPDFGVMVSTVDMPIADDTELQKYSKVSNLISFSFFVTYYQYYWIWV